MAEKRPKNAPMRQIAKSVHADLWIITLNPLLLRHKPRRGVFIRHVTSNREKKAY